MKQFYFLLYLALIILLGCTGKKTKEKSSVNEFISANWDNTIRFHPNDSGTLIGLPKPYTVACISGMFQEMYYWDTYFINVGLIKCGRIEQAINNTENICFLVDRYGFMPNGNRTWFLNRSQPPYLSMMIKDIYDQTKDKEWLKLVLPSLEREYNFWMEKRMTPIGLNHFSNEISDSLKIIEYFAIKSRLGENYKPDSTLSVAEQIRAGSHFTSEFESGWDMNPRYENHCEDFCPVDLNCNLYMYEKNFAFFYIELNKGNASNWENVAKHRLELINQFCLNKQDGLFYDYSYADNHQSKVLSAAIFNTLWSHLATKGQAGNIIKNLNLLEFDYGIAACSPGQRSYTYQWDYPNGWANMQFLAIAGLNNYGYQTDAKRLALKYVSAIDKTFANTGNIWEKYNVTDASINVTNEYEMPPMMDWTAGVYVFASEYLKENN
jgi:alpha,alpha-trehalase